VSGPGVPPGGFRWVEPAGDRPAGRPGPLMPALVEPPSRRRRWWVVAVGTVVVALIVGGVLVWRPWQGGSSPAAVAGRPTPVIGTPKDLLIGFSLRQRPVPGWRLSTADLGLPAGYEQGSMFASNGDKAFFSTLNYCGVQDCTPYTAWIYGVDVRAGKRLFATPVVDAYISNDCASNGPSLAVCTYLHHNQNYAAVINLDNGALIYQGPTELDIGLKTVLGEKGGVTRVIAKRQDYNAEGKPTGAYGVGPRTEFTWFAPGNGTVSVPGYLHHNDIPSLTIATQSTSGHGPTRVFSMVDGHDLTPTPPDGVTIDQATVYNGGFAYQFTQGDTIAGILFYDTDGHLLARRQKGRAYFQDNPAMPTILEEGKWKVFTADGTLVLEMPAVDLVGEFKTIGTTIYSRAPLTIHDPDGADEKPWQAWDLLTGQKIGPDCHYPIDDMGGYAGSDGKVLITVKDAVKGGIVAVDMATCQPLWEPPAKTGYLQVGANLLAVEDHQTLMSVHAPN
jgi:hypothetical protein